MKKINIHSLNKMLCFILLLYSFNVTIKSRFFWGNSSYFFLVVLAIVGLLFIGLYNSKNRFKKKQLFYFLITCSIVFIELFRNYYFKESSESKVFFFTAYLFLPFVLSINYDAVNDFFKVIKIFCIEHVIGTFFVQFFKNFYLSKIYPWLFSGKITVAYSNLQHGYNPGLTTHYSTNGIYLSISVIYFFSNYLVYKNKRDFMWMCLSFIALLLTGKRAHTLFVLISCVVLYLNRYKEKMSKKVVNLIILGISGIIGILILSMFVPQVMNVVERFDSTAEKGELLSGREPFYDLALEIWQENKIFGKGWGAFSYYFQLKLYNDAFIYGYLDGHNVYLQLLCECGIVGAFYLICIAIKLFLSCSETLKKSENTNTQIFSYVFQVFFLLYCFSGNPLYDIQCYAIYFFTLGITLGNSSSASIKVKE